MCPPVGISWEEKAPSRHSSSAGSLLFTAQGSWSCLLRHKWGSFPPHTCSKLPQHHPALKVQQSPRGGVGVTESFSVPLCHLHWCAFLVHLLFDVHLWYLSFNCYRSWFWWSEVEASRTRSTGCIHVCRGPPPSRSGHVSRARSSGVGGTVI